MTLIYHYTNESLDAIVKGLGVNETDNIIAVCGSGDQAFALLEYANSVVAVDNNEEQVVYALKRAEALAMKDYSSFFPENFRRVEYRKKSKDYFLAGSRLERIREKLDKLEIRHATDFLDGLGDRKFSKAYLSNIIFYDMFLAGWRERKKFMQKLASSLSAPGLIYIMNGIDIDSDFKGLWCIKRENGLSQIARELELTNNHNPRNASVYRQAGGIIGWVARRRA